MELATFPIVMLICFSSCTGNNARENPGKEKKQETLTQISESPDPEIMERGELLYKQHCLACHQTDGSGNPGMYPPLQQTEIVLDDPEQMISIVLNGLSGPITVKGEEYNSVMAPYNFLKDNEIADLLTYVRNSFGNESGKISPEEVAAIRNTVQ